MFLTYPLSTYVVSESALFFLYGATCLAGVDCFGIQPSIVCIEFTFTQYPRQNKTVNNKTKQKTQHASLLREIKKKPSLEVRASLGSEIGAGSKSFRKF